MHGLFFWKTKKDVTITNAFQKVLDKSNRNETKYGQIDKASEFQNRSIKSWLQINDIEMYSTHNEGQSVVGERFIRTVKNKI